MARFVYLADSHFGAGPSGYRQQTAHPARLREIAAALADFIRNDGAIDFVLHGGDLVDRGTRALISGAEELFRLPVPVHLCLGNHDLTERRSLAAWQVLGRRFLPGGGRPEFTIEAGECRIHVVPNQWGGELYHWREDQTPGFTAEQLAWLERALASRPEALHLLATHSPVLPLPEGQMGAGVVPPHGTDEAFAACIAGLARRHPGLRCVLGAHSHLNMCVEQESVHYVTVSALVEAPFEFKVLEAGPGTLRMETHSLQGALRFDGGRDPARAFVQGRPEDRGFEVRWR